MVWKQDLAKLKQQFKEAGEPKPKAQVPKPVPKPEAAGSIEDEDSLFLNAMGQRRAAPSPAPIKEKALPPTQAAPSAPPPPPVEDFQTAMGGLKGLKPLAPRIPVESPKEQPVPPPVEPLENSVPVAPPEVAGAVVVPAAPSVEAPPRTGPTLIHLAAGMAIEVDGSLDLRGHTAVDALERLRERLQDGVFLGWRTFHVTLGTSDEVRDSFLAFLGDPEARAITRYAQAPIPMGGSQAWILYYASPTAH